MVWLALFFVFMWFIAELYNAISGQPVPRPQRPDVELNRRLGLDDNDPNGEAKARHAFLDMMLYPEDYQWMDPGRHLKP